MLGFQMGSSRAGWLAAIREAAAALFAEPLSWKGPLEIS